MPRTCSHCDEPIDSPKTCTFCYSRWEVSRRVKLNAQSIEDGINVRYIRRVVLELLAGERTLSYRYYNRVLTQPMRETFLNTIERMAGWPYDSFDRCDCRECYDYLAERIDTWVYDNPGFTVQSV